MTGNQNAAKGITEQKTVAPQCEVIVAKKHSTPSADKKASMLDVSRPAVERAEIIKRKAPELALTA
ncbi:hypothetical protein FACS1894216_11250 [Synergistales bacterium]|nr:hypothetical protein FACS1894216_11250 [Synergistales bacterium]